MSDRNTLETLFHKHGFSDFRWISPEHIVVAQWVRMKCTFGCVEYGHNACCPPNVPAVDACERFFREYSDAAIFHFEEAVDKPEDRFAWSRKVNLNLLKLEQEVFLSGYQKAFLLFMDTCCICSDCSTKRGECNNPKQSRPAPEALAVDVFATVRKCGYPIEVLSDTSQMMNRYAFLMVE